MIAAVLSGPNYFSPNHDEHNIEVHANLEEVIEALFDRYSSNGRRHCTYTTLNGEDHTTLFSGFEPGMNFTCYQVPVNFQSPAMKAEALEEVLTCVNLGMWDYTVTLAHSEQGTLTAVVERAGI